MFTWKGLLIRKLLWLCHLLVDITIVPVRRLNVEYGFPKNWEVVVMPNPVLLIPNETQFEDFFLHVGQLVEQKDQMFLIDIFNSIIKMVDQKINNNWAGEKEIPLKNYVKKLKLEKIIFLDGWTTHINIWLEQLLF